MLLDPDTPAEKGSIALYEERDGRWEWAGPGEPTDLSSAGRFEIESLAAGDYVVVAKVKGRASDIAFVTVGAEVEPLTLTCSEGIPCTIDVPRGSRLPASHQALRILDGDGVPVYDDRSGASLLFRDLASYSLRLLPGRYVAEVRTRDGSLRRVEFDATPDARVTLPLPD